MVPLSFTFGCVCSPFVAILQREVKLEAALAFETGRWPPRLGDRFCFIFVSFLFRFVSFFSFFFIFFHFCFILVSFFFIFFSFHFCFICFHLCFIYVSFHFFHLFFIPLFLQREAKLEAALAFERGKREWETSLALKNERGYHRLLLAKEHLTHSLATSSSNSSSHQVIHCAVAESTMMMLNPWCCC
jgi:hypothetical protein